MSDLSQGRGNQRIGRRRTSRTPHYTILKIDKEIAQKGHLESETLVVDLDKRKPLRRSRRSGL
jgi:hypothetical protein